MNGGKPFLCGIGHFLRAIHGVQGAEYFDFEKGEPFDMARSSEDAMGYASRDPALHAVLNGVTNGYNRRNSRRTRYYHNISWGCAGPGNRLHGFHVLSVS